MEQSLSDAIALIELHSWRTGCAAPRIFAGLDAQE